MKGKIKEIIRKAPGMNRLLAAMEENQEAIRILNYENLIIAQEGIDLRLKMKKNAGEKINVVFVCHRPAIWGSLQSVYEALMADERFRVTIVTIPNKKQLPGKGLRHEEYEWEGAEEFWKGEECLKGYDDETGEWLDLRSLRPDYLFFQQPYNIARPMQYRSPIVSKYCKIAYVAYFAPTDFGEIYDECAPIDYLSDLSFFFAQHRRDEQHVRERFGLFDNTCQIINTGYPRYDHIEDYKGQNCGIWNSEESFKILWTPRWTTNEDNCFFFAYKDHFNAYCKAHPEIEFTFRPHPQAFREWQATGEMTAEEITRFKASYVGNMHLDEAKTYFPLMFSTDCLVTDKSSMLVDFFFTGKPIILCRNDNIKSSAYEELAEGIYEVYSWNELEDRIQRLMSGEDPLKEKRREIAEGFLRRSGQKASALIHDILLADAMK